ncbi:glucan biosynthesis protein, partial [Pantoea sp. GbtcB22]|uniref:glucan biosynthesis protein n=1 Tax=Pantoea sp. GbtcB22 TaxID=2824767 RepID=UPI001C30B942
TPEKLPEPGKVMNFQYRLHFTRDGNQLHSDDIAWVKDTLRSAGGVKQSNLVRQPDGSIAFTVDFVGKAMSKLPEETQEAPQG